MSWIIIGTSGVVLIILGPVYVTNPSECPENAKYLSKKYCIYPNETLTYTYYDHQTYIKGVIMVSLGCGFILLWCIIPTLSKKIGMDFQEYLPDR